MFFNNISEPRWVGRAMVPDLHIPGAARALLRLFLNPPHQSHAVGAHTAPLTCMLPFSELGYMWMSVLSRGPT